MFHVPDVHLSFASKHDELSSQNPKIIFKARLILQDNYYDRLILLDNITFIRYKKTIIVHIHDWVLPYTHTLTHIYIKQL